MGIITGFSDKPVFIPGLNGYYKLNNCFIECIELHISADREHTITLKAHKIEEVDDLFNQNSTKNLDDYTNIELLEELEKRTKSNI